jgi:hypothetical protein
MFATFAKGLEGLEEVGEVKLLLEVGGRRGKKLNWV